MDAPIYHLEKVVRARTDGMEDFNGPLDLILSLLAKNKMERKRFIYLVYAYTSITEGCQGSSLLMQRPWMGAAYWLAPHGLLSLLSD